DLVLLQRCAPPALPRIETHQRSMRGLLQRIEREETDGGLDGTLRRLTLGLVGEQPGEGLEGELSEPLALSQKPLLERWFVDAEPFEQIALVESHRALERLGRALGHQLLESDGIDVHSCWLQGDGLGLSEKDLRRETAHGLTNGEQRVPEVTPR